ncbi:MAG: hypothetical protein A3B10_02570 [Candidatus Doudnabacteria bacterium RIFCSPLOWO2_01_FULL_44_21]|uniref:Uncharacterized protein n=1 Tax=Candidatus Doudnabacteria bacterium RIFCSPLOWO2_01_FULL_44_21 TaxID=1817841 RepID=A0A1F5PX55_9BACT|nr:MAG: hypothetical protein A3B95_00880 [Candidatus Doudnabacteria bacterium RIFCSPHIGHO2_02_FULL_43_13b]OGE94511.1 MAG: hypothetical protein A3B10_02570 [Candidatus Doudnabacteria bacterium RIFCSPLOWO2_01_FULL_44_21]
MSKIIQRFESFFFASRIEANERVSDLIIQLRSPRIPFVISEFEEKGSKYLLAESSPDYTRGTILATGKNKEELALNLKNAIFSAYSIPYWYCNPDLINLDGALASTEKKPVYATT